MHHKSFQQKQEQKSMLDLYSTCLAPGGSNQVMKYTFFKLNRHQKKPVGRNGKICC